MHMISPYHCRIVPPTGLCGVGYSLLLRVAKSSSVMAPERLLPSHKHNPTTHEHDHPTKKNDSSPTIFVLHGCSTRQGFGLVLRVAPTMTGPPSSAKYLPIAHDLLRLCGPQRQRKKRGHFG